MSILMCLFCDYFLNTQPWAVSGRYPGKGMAMTITLSDFEVIIVMLTIIWIYVVWRQGNKKQ